MAIDICVVESFFCCIFFLNSFRLEMNFVPSHLILRYTEIGSIEANRTMQFEKVQ